MALPQTLTTCLLMMPLLVALPGNAEDTPLIEDPAGDAGLLGAAAPVAWDHYDIVRVTVVDETDDVATIRIETVAPGTEPPAGEIAVHFEAAGSWFLMGWSTVAFPAPPFVYQGGFFCPSDADQGTDPATCGGLPASFGADGLDITVSRETFGLTARGTTITTPTAYSVLYDADGDPLPIDETDIGGMYVFQTGKTPAANGADTTSAPAATNASDPDPSIESNQPEQTTTPRTNAEAPGAPLIAAVLMLLGLAIDRRRQHAA